MAKPWAKKFYASKAWRELREVLINERGPVCAKCKNIIADTSKLIGHHKIQLTPENINNPDIALNPDNIELVCYDCHNKEHKRFGNSSHNIYLIYGAPCSGKSTMLNQLKERGDLVIDMDLLYMAISGCSMYDKPDNLKLNIFRVRDLLLDHIRTRYGKWNDAYIIGGYPRKQEREELAMKLGAELIYCEATIDGCLARAERRGVYADEWQGYIKKWFDTFQA